MRLTLVTPEKKWVSDLEIDEVILPGERGELDILPGHAPLMTTLSVGTLAYKKKGQDQWIRAVVSWGYCEVSPQGVLVLAETVETKEDLDKARAEKALQTAEGQLESGQLDPEGIVKYQRKVKRSLERIRLTEL